MRTRARRRRRTPSRPSWRHSATVKILATSREGLGVADEQLWPVPSLDVDGGIDSAAVNLFVERARSVAPRFSLANADEAVAVVEICRRLDGIPLAIELAASRMASMTASEVRDRLDQRFRLLVRSRRRPWTTTTRFVTRWRGPTTCSTMRRRGYWHAVRCSPVDSTSPLRAQSVAAATTWPHWMCSMRWCASPLWSPTDHRGGPGFRCWKTIRQFAEEQLLASGSADEVRAAHARHFAGRETDVLALWDSPRQREAYAWFTAELADLRTAFRWAADHDEPRRCRHHRHLRRVPRFSAREL